MLPATLSILSEGGAKLGLLLKGGHVMDPDRHDGIMDILVKDGQIKAVKPQIAATQLPGHLNENISVVDCTGCIVCPGFIDIHVHLREPGFEYKETIESGCRSAAHGGFTAICSMPNTSPANDDPAVTAFILEKARQDELPVSLPIREVPTYRMMNHASSGGYDGLAR